MTDGDERVSPSRWPELWFRDEKFWRDVASRTVSALVVALLAYLFAVVAGYVKSPRGWPVAAMFGAGIVAFWLLRGIAGVLNWSDYRNRRWYQRNRRVNAAVQFFFFFQSLLWFLFGVAVLVFALTR